MSIQEKTFGTLQDGREVKLYTLQNSLGMSVDITNFGGIVVALRVPDRNEELADIVFGHDELEPYTRSGPYFGAIIGRHANRIEDASFVLNGVEYKLTVNNGRNHTHGGTIGFDKVLWHANPIHEQEAEALELTYLSKDGEEGYPGNLQVKVTYRLTNEGTLSLEYQGTSDQDTIINLTNHTYFNLSGHQSGTILHHELTIDANQFTPVNIEGLPTGELREVANTPMDFTSPTPLGEGINSSYEQVAQCHGYDHNWVLRTAGNLQARAARLYDPSTGRCMDMYTTKPGVQIFTSNFQQDAFPGKQGAVYRHHQGICLETQFFPNAMKHPHFPSIVLRAGETYHHITNYCFSVL